MGWAWVLLQKIVKRLALIALAEKVIIVGATGRVCFATVHSMNISAIFVCMH